MEKDPKEPICAICGYPVVGGKGDWWHKNTLGGYGEMIGMDGHIACPFLTIEED